jgi:Flp pilus assembly protein TadB
MTEPLMFLGAGIGAGLTLIVYGLAPARPSLAAVVDELHRLTPTARSARVRAVHALGQPLGRLGLPRAQIRTDLAILDRDPTVHLASQAALTGLGLLAPPATVAGMNLMGAGIGWSVPLWLGLALAVGGFVVSDLSVHADAEDRRRLMRHTLSALLDIVPPALAAGAGVEQALNDATAIASGWAADRLRDALDTARYSRTPVWQPLRELGESIGVVELEQLAGTLHLAAGEGTRIRDALTQRGGALSEKVTADMEARAESATERMSIPLMALTSVFLLFLLYPAAAAMHR